MSLWQLSKVSTVLLVVVFLLNCGGVGKTPVSTSGGPTVSMVVPESGGIATNREIAVLFSQPMDPASINSGTFLIAGMTGTVVYDATNMIGAFKPSQPFAPNTAYNASIGVGAKDMSETPLAAPFNFSFTTIATSDTSTPYVVAVNLVAGASCVPQNQKASVTFGEQMDSLTINSNTLYLVAANAAVAATVTYDVVHQQATVTPSATLAANTAYWIEIASGANDMSERPIVPSQQTFTTGPCAAGETQPVALCPSIGNFSVLAGTTVTNTGSTVVSGDVGVCPGLAVTGFPPGTATGGAPIVGTSGVAFQAQASLTAGYIDAAGRAGGTSEAGDLVGKTLTAGVYTSTSSLMNSGDLTLDAQGNPNAVFIFQIASTLITGSGSHIILANGALACNVFWQVGSSATLGTNSSFAGTIMALTSITITTGVTLDGRALARNGAVTLDSDVINGCACSSTVY